jgi:hypothetical protein
MVETRKSLTRDPEREFLEPHYLVERQDISAEDKLTLLKNWHADLLELQRASEENMPSANVPAGLAAEKLSKVAQAIELVGKGLSHSSTN